MTVCRRTPHALGRRRHLQQPLLAGAAAVQAHQRVALAQRHRRPVQVLLDRQALGRHVAGLAHLERALGRRPLVGAGADQLQQPARRRHLGPAALQHRGDRVGHSLQPAQVGAQRLRQLGQSAACAPVWLAVKAEDVSGVDRLEIRARHAAGADRHHRRALRSCRARPPGWCTAWCRGG